MDLHLRLPDSTAREHVFRWMESEYPYVESKIDNGAFKRDEHDATLIEYDPSFWVPQVMQYYDRAKAFLQGAKEAAANKQFEDAVELEKRAQQAIAKAMMTAIDFTASAVRVYGTLPKPGVNSGKIEEWEVGA